MPTLTPLIENTKSDPGGNLIKILEDLVRSWKIL